MTLLLLLGCRLSCKLLYILIPENHCRSWAIFFLVLSFQILSLKDMYISSIKSQTQFKNCSLLCRQFVMQCCPILDQSVFSRMRNASEQRISMDRTQLPRSHLDYLLKQLFVSTATVFLKSQCIHRIAEAWRFEVKILFFWLLIGFHQ